MSTEMKSSAVMSVASVPRRIVRYSTGAVT